MKNMRELRESLIKVHEDVVKGDIDYKTAQSASQTASAIMKSVGQQLMYSKARKEKPEIGFMKCK